MFNRTISALGAAAVAASALLVAVPASAAPAGEDGLAISYVGYDLANPADAARFERTVANAAASYCGQVPALDFRLEAKVRSCRTAIVANAKADVALALADHGRGTTIALRTN
jgi:UrcA family protein